MTAATVVDLALRIVTGVALTYCVHSARRLTRYEMRALTLTRRHLASARKLGLAHLVTEYQFRIADHHRRIRWLRRLGLHALIPIEPERPRQ